MKDPQPRRKFLKSATMTTVSAGLALGASQLVLGQKGRRIDPVTEKLGQQIPIKAQRDPLFYFTRATFDPYVGGIFTASNALGEMVELKLVRVSAYEVQPVTKITTKKTRQSDSFSLTFTSTERLPKFTSIHKISHPALGNFDLFLTSHQLEDGTFTYEAVINHI